MYAMFGDCKDLEYLDLSNFNTSNVTNMQFMFDGCNKLKQIKGINNFNTINVTKMTGMFQECNELEYLDLSNFNTSNVTDMSQMFKKCHKLKQIKGINNFNISKIVNKEEMFEECYELEYLLLSRFNISNDINKNYKERLKNQLNEEKKINLQLINILNKQQELMDEMLDNSSEKAIAIIFRAIDQTIIYPIACKVSDIFSNVEEKLYHEFPELRKKNIVFIANGKTINRTKTLYQNGINGGTTILMQYY